MTENGGAVSIGGDTFSIAFSGVTFLNNRAGAEGGAMSIDRLEAAGTVVNTTFEDNCASQGGGVSIEITADVSFVDCDFKYVSLSRTIAEMTEISHFQ